MKKWIALVAVWWTAVTPSAMAEMMDLAHYRAEATTVIRESMKGDGADVTAMLQRLEQLMRLGVDSCRSYDTSNPVHAKLLQLTADSAEAMKAMSLEQIEEEWHEFGFLARNGIDAEAIEHFGPVISLMDSVVHPATAIIALQKHQQTPDVEYLEQVKAELSEVLEHLKYIQ